jgi:hypothetical protein
MSQTVPTAEITSEISDDWQRIYIIFGRSAWDIGNQDSCVFVAVAHDACGARYANGFATESGRFGHRSRRREAILRIQLSGLRCSCAEGVGKGLAREA